MGNKPNHTKSLYNIFFDICIVGGGPSGMAAAITAMESNPTLKVCIVEKNQEIGKKLLATGNGRCNVTNSRCKEYGIVEDFLRKTGILLKEESEGRMYPFSEQAVSVVELLKYRVKTLNITIFSNCTVFNISENEANGFDVDIDCPNEKVFIPCSKVLIACGGKAAPQFGTSGDGYTLAKQTGHRTSKVYPILMPLECDGIREGLKGIRAKGKASLLKDEELVAEECGEIQFTEDGLSGICIFNLTRFLKLNGIEGESMKEAFRHYSIELDFLPEMEEMEVMRMLEDRRSDMAGMPADSYLYSVINTKLAEFITDEVLGEEKGNIGNIAYEGIEEIAMLLKSSRFAVTGAKGWKSAQCTGGGVLLEDVNLQSLESKVKKGIFFAGEVLDYDGPCGGYNLQNSWLTGIRAGKGLAASLAEIPVIGE